MSSLSVALLACCAALGAAAPVFMSHQAKLQPAAKADKALLQAPMFGTEWFAGDARRIAQMPPYIPSKVDKYPGGNPQHAPCTPKCGWGCGKSECDQTCEPLCLPPTCETLCMKSDDKCETRCNKPKCAVICPSAAAPCPSGDCPKCRTICAPPACTTSCSPGSCHSVCTQPQCTWKCDKGVCPAPECKMTCSGFEGNCKDPFADPFSALPKKEEKVPLMPGMDIKSKGKASMDPKTLYDKQTPPAPGPLDGPQVLQQPHGGAESSLGHQKTNGLGNQPPPSPMTLLKSKWKAEDMVTDNERLLRR